MRSFARARAASKSTCLLFSALSYRVSSTQSGLVLPDLGKVMRYTELPTDNSRGRVRRICARFGQNDNAKTEDPELHPGGICTGCKRDRVADPFRLCTRDCWPDLLIHGAAGNVGAYAVQLANQAGLHVVATAASADREYVRHLGAERVVDYRTERFDESLTGVDVVLDTVGGETQQRSLRVLKPGGILVSVVSPVPEATQSAMAFE